jgi:hypothetical protein
VGDEKNCAPSGVDAPQGGEKSERFGGGSQDFGNTNWRANQKTSSRRFADKCAWALASALDLASHGYSSFPCWANKRPATPRGFKDATAHPEQLRALWSLHPGDLIGVSTGFFSGVDVLDIDAKHIEASQWWGTHRDRIPATRVHRTRSGGLHLLFRHAPGVRCSVGRIALGIDVRGDGGYAIWWPTAGLPVLQDAPLAAWPAWLLAQLSPPTRPASARTILSDPAQLSPPPAFARITLPDDYELTRWVRLVAGACEGERNKIAFWAACRVSEMATSGRLSCSGTTAVAVIAEAAVRAGLPRTEADRTARSGLEAGGRAHG